MDTIREDGTREALDEESKMNDKPTILVTTVDIGGGRSDTIAIRRGDDPADLARAFCELHSLPEGVLGPLTEHLLDNLRKALSQASPGSLDANSVAASPLPPMHMTESPLRPQRPPDDEHDPHDDQDQAYLPEMDMEFKGFSPERPSRTPPQQQHGSVPLSFNNPNDRNQLYEQLSAKMVQVDPMTMLTVSSAEGKRSSARKGGPNRHVSQSADPSPRDSVYLRLYNKAQDQAKRAEARRAMQSAEVAASIAATKTSMSWISASMMRDRTHGPFENYGEMLYAEGLEAEAIKRSKAAAVLAEKRSRELDGATFRPEITALARALCSDGGYQSQPAWQRLSHQNKTKVQERLQEIKKMKEMDETKECTFKPVINSRSRAMMWDREEMLREMRMTAHEQLFQDAIRRQHKMEELATWVPDDYTFKPAVNQNKVSKDYLRRSLEPTRDSPSKSTVPPVVERLYASHEKTKAKLEANRAKYHGPTDPVTGKPLYKPDVGRAPRSRQPSSSPPVHQMLYAQGLEMMCKKELAQDAERRQAEMEARTTHTLSLSDKLFKRLKHKRFAQIFEYLLDEAHVDVGIDLVALVRQPTSHMENLDNEVREDVVVAAEIHASASGVPLFPEGPFEEEEEVASALAALPPAPPVTLEGFVSLMESALQQRRGPRAYLVPSPSAKHNPEPTFRPVINPRSRELAARLRPAEVEIYEILYQRADASRAKLEEARRMLEEAELRECTFMPMINSASLAAEGRALRQAAKQAVNKTTTPRTPRSNNAAVKQTRSSQPRDIDEDAQFLALEREVHEALAGASLTASQLDRNLPAALKAQLGGDVDPADLRATEEMLLDLLGGGAGMDGEGSGMMSGGALSLQDLANELNQWDHQADPSSIRAAKTVSATGC